MRIDGWGSRMAPYGLRCTVHRQMAVKLREGDERGRGEREGERGEVTKVRGISLLSNCRIFLCVYMSTHNALCTSFLQGNGWTLHTVYNKSLKRPTLNFEH